MGLTESAIHDILETVDRVQTKTAGGTFAEFQADWELRFIVQRAIEIISEATRRLPPELKAGQPDISWRDIAGIGNVLRHRYHAVSDNIIWNVVQHDLPSLRLAVEAIAAMVEGDDPGNS